MGKLIAIGGRGGGVLLKLYLALVWRSSAKPFATKLSARKWAELLALPDPSKNGARRVTDALKTLAEPRLIAVEHRRGDPSVVTLLREDGSGQPYTVPRGANGDYYFQIPAQMWITGQLQKLSAPGIAMLMAVLAEQKGKPGQSGLVVNHNVPGEIRAVIRHSGARDAGVTGGRPTGGGAKAGATHSRKSFSTDHVRSIYRVTGVALLEPLTTQPERLFLNTFLPAKDAAEFKPSAHNTLDEKLSTRPFDLSLWRCDDRSWS